MKIIFSKHALLKVQQRGLDKVKVIETILNPDFIQPSYNFRESRFRLYEKIHLKAVVIVRQDRILVVTAHWVAKQKPK
jgi:hypothetical protein